MTRHSESRSRRPRDRVLRLCVFMAAAGCGGSDSTVPRILEIGIQPTLIQTEVPLHDIKDVLVSGDHIWILNGIEPFIVFYRRDSDRSVAFGQQGPGPTELQTPWYLLRADSDHAVRIWDVGRRAILRADTAGVVHVAGRLASQLGSVRADLRDITHGTPLKAAVAEHGRMVLQTTPGGIMRPRNMFSSRLVSVDSKGVIRDTLVVFQPPADTILPSRSQFLVPVPLWDACSPDLLVIVDAASNEVRWIDTQGRVDARTPIPVTPPPLSEQDLRRYLTHSLRMELRQPDATPPPNVLESAVDQVLERSRSVFPKIGPAVTSVICDDSNRAWLQHFSTQIDPRGYGSLWTILTRNGDVRQVRFPPRFRPLTVRSGSAYGIHIDELDVQRIGITSIAAVN